MIDHEIPSGIQRLPIRRYIERAWPMMPTRVMADALKRRDIRVNGTKAGADAFVKGGDRLLLYVDDKYAAGDVPVLFEDGRILVVNKPAGLPVDVDQDGIGADTLIERIRQKYPSARLCHRLDAGTGGVLVCALEDEIYRAVLAAFRENRVSKTYRAVICGCPSVRQARLAAFLLKDEKSSKVYVYDAPRLGGQKIITEYRVIDEAFQGEGALALAEIGLITGRTHQIRAHMAHIGHPLLGDDKYGDRQINKKYRAKEPFLFCSMIVLSGDGAIAAYDGRVFSADDSFALGRKTEENTDEN